MEVHVRNTTSQTAQQGSSVVMHDEILWIEFQTCVCVSGDTPTCVFTCNIINGHIHVHVYSAYMYVCSTCAIL